MAGFENDIMFAKNADFTQADNQAPTEANGLFTNGQIWIGRTAANAGGTHIDVNTLTAGTGIAITNGAGSITIAVSGGGIVNSITAGDNINLTGTASNPIINLNPQILEPTASAFTSAAYSFVANPDTGMTFAFGQVYFVFNGNPNLSFGGDNVNVLANYFRIQGALELFNVIIKTSNYASTSTDLVILVDSTSGAFAVTLPTAASFSSVPGHTVIIKDYTGVCATNNVTINTSDTKTIDGLSTFVMSSNYVSATFLFNGSNWSVI